MPIKKILPFLLLNNLFLLQVIFSQAPINILSVQQGLPRSQIYDIVQDTFGFIWLGTRDGLVKFDGYQPTIYRYGSSDIPFNYTYDLFIDSRNRLWMSGNADYKGAASLNLENLEFGHLHKAKYPGLANDGIVAIAESHAGEMIFLTKDFQLNKLNRDETQIVSWDLQQYLDPTFPEVINVTRMLADPWFSDEYWICTIEGLFKFNTASEKFTEILKKESWEPTTLFYDPAFPNDLWVGLTSIGGLMKIDLKYPSRKVYYGIDTTISFHDRLTTSGQSVFVVIDICKKSPDELYVSTANRGIGVFNKTNGTFDFQLHQSSMLETDFVRAIYSNSKGEFWAGTDKNGLFYLRPENSELKLRLFPEINQLRSEFRLDDIEHIGNEKYLLSFYRYPEIWIWDRLKDQFEKVNFELPIRYGEDIQLYQNSWFLGTNRKLFELDLGNARLISDVIPLPDEVTHINKIIEDGNGIWLQAWGYGIIYFDGVHTKLFPGAKDPQGLKHKWTHDIEVGPNGHLWVGQENGLYRIESKETIYTISYSDQLRGFGNPNFKALTFDNQGRLWTGNFGGGIRCYDIIHDTIICQLTVAEGLPSDRIYDLITDEEGFIWVWTSEGLCSFSPENLEDLHLTYYPNTRFLPVDRNGIWFRKIHTGEIFFGVSGGFASFHPHLLRESSKQVPQAPILTGFKIFDEELPMDRFVDRGEAIQLKAKENFFSISFSAPKSGFNSQQHFRYQLIGVDEDWVEAGNERTATYTNLDPGEYQFVVKVMDHNNVWSAPISPLPIILAAPWYLQGWAKILWIILMFLAAYGIYRFLVLRERERNQLSFQRIEAKNLRELDASKSNFFAQISHEFRTPLTIILGMTGELRRMLQPKPELQKSLDSIDRNADILLKQINQILDLSKLRSKSIQLTLIHGDVIRYFRYLIEAFYEFARSKKIELNLQCKKDEIWMDFDPQRLKDVFINILSNALKFSPENSQIKVSVEKIEQDGKLLLELQFIDQGIGIPANKLENIFEPYTQAKQTGSIGTGLGLAIAQQWVQAMGGQISVWSKEGIGSRFTVHIPILKDAEKSTAIIPEIKQTATISNQINQKKVTKSKAEAPVILIVEDNHDVIDYISNCLEGFNIIKALDGERGIKSAIQKVPDLILTDIMMPRMDGYELCTLIKENEITNHIPIIMLTAKADPGEKKAGLSLGADAYLTKPFDREELLIRVHNLLNQRKLLQKKFMQFPAMENDTEPVGDQFLERIQDFVYMHIARDFTVTELARHLGLSRVQLYRKVKALTDKSVSQYIRFLRLYKARQLLRQGQMNISEVAYAVGFGDPSYFSKVFREVFEMSPSDVKT